MATRRDLDDPTTILSVVARVQSTEQLALLKALTEAGATSLLIEGGGQVAAAFLRAQAVDALEWFRAPILLGGEGRPCVASLALAKLADAPKFRRLGVEPVGDDLWERYARFDG